MNNEIEQKKYNFKDKELYIKELLMENNLLLEQLNLVQEKIEEYHYTLKNTSNNENFIIPHKINSILIENIKLHSLVNQQIIAIQIERQNRISARLGEILIKSVNSIGEFILLPFKLLRIWKALKKTTPPDSLGVNFQKVIDAYTTGGLEYVDRLLNSVFISSVMRANAYTALARHLMLSDINQTAYLARLAWETDPRPYRLKWLAFRLHEAGDSITAEALLSMLPSNINLTKSEEKHIRKIKEDSNFDCSQEIKKITNIALEEIIKKNELVTNLKQSIKDEKYKNLTIINKFNKLEEKYKLEISNLHIQINDKQKVNELLYQKLHKIEEEHKSEINNLNLQILEQKKNIDKLHQEFLFISEQKNKQQLQIESLKKYWLFGGICG